MFALTLTVFAFEGAFGALAGAADGAAAGGLGAPAGGAAAGELGDPGDVETGGELEDPAAEATDGAGVASAIWELSSPMWMATTVRSLTAENKHSAAKKRNFMRILGHSHRDGPPELCLPD